MTTSTKIGNDTSAKKPLTMDDLLANSVESPVEEGALLPGKVLAVKKNEILVDLGARGVAQIPRREIGWGKKYEIGDTVEVNIIDPDMDDGYILGSLRRASKDKGWDEVQRVVEEGNSIEVVPYDANRGGLLIEFEGVRGFMPVSQLGPQNYPRTSDKEEIFAKLKTLVGKPMMAQILDCDQKNNKLIFSEKEAIKDGLSAKLTSMKVGEIAHGIVTGIVDFGAFVNVDGIEGLVHISEISWERIANVNDKLKLGDKIDAKIISIDKDRLSLSIKQTLPDPWISESAKFFVGEVVEGTVTRITPFGAFVQISPSVEALVHISEIGGEGVNPESIFTLNEKRNFVILEIDTENKKISLGLAKKK